MQARAAEAFAESTAALSLFDLLRFEVRLLLATALVDEVFIYLVIVHLGAEGVLTWPGCVAIFVEVQREEEREKVLTGARHCGNVLGRERQVRFR